MVPPHNALAGRGLSRGNGQIAVPDGLIAFAMIPQRKWAI